MTQCKFIDGWRGQCENEAEPGDEYCIIHKDKKCCVCGEQATHSCEETMGGFVCGMPLCNNCEHEYDENGSNGMALKHTRKENQKYTSWLVRAECEHCGYEGNLAAKPHNFINIDGFIYIKCGNCGKILE